MSVTLLRISSVFPVTVYKEASSCCTGDISMEFRSGAVFTVLSILSLVAGSNAKEAFVFDAGAGQLPEHGNRGIHCRVTTGEKIPIIDIDGIIRTELSILLEDPIYATSISNLKCYIPLPSSIGTTISLNGSTLQVDYGSTLGKFSILLLHIPDDDKGKSCDSVENSGSGHEVRQEGKMAVDLHFDRDKPPVINITGDNGIYFHYCILLPTTNLVVVYVNNVSVHRDANFQLYYTHGTCITGFLEIVNVTNIENNTMIEITMGSSDGNCIHTSIIKPQGGPCPRSASKTIHNTLYLLLLEIMSIALSIAIFVLYIAGS